MFSQRIHITPHMELARGRANTYTAQRTILNRSPVNRHGGVHPPQVLGLGTQISREWVLVSILQVGVFLVVGGWRALRLHDLLLFRLLPMMTMLFILSVDSILIQALGNGHIVVADMGSSILVMTMRKRLVQIGLEGRRQRMLLLLLLLDDLLLRLGPLHCIPVQPIGGALLCFGGYCCHCVVWYYLGLISRPSALALFLMSSRQDNPQVRSACLLHGWLLKTRSYYA